MAKQKTLLDEQKRKTEMDDLAAEIAEESPEEETNGGFQRLMEKDVTLNPEIQGIILKDGGRCDQLTTEQAAEYVCFLCAKIGVDPTFRPIDLIQTKKNGIRPYLNKGASERIRDTRKISIIGIEVKDVNNMWIVMCHGKGKDGRVDTDIGVCMKNGTEKSPLDPNDALMKAVTKAKRRLTLSMCGLGAIIEEAHPTEYNNDAVQEECKSAILLEDESKTKKTFRDVVLSKVERDDLPKEILASLLEQAGHLANTNSVAEAAKWLQEKGEISVTTRKDVVTKAVIKEVKNEARKG